MSAPGVPNQMPATGTPPSATPQNLRYADDIDVGLNGDALSFLDDAAKGHRVSINVDLADMQSLIVVNRGLGDRVPVGSLNPSSTLLTALDTAMAGKSAWTDLDAGNLSFTSGATVPANGWASTGAIADWVFQYVLYKVYGSSAYDVSKVTYTAAATSMVTNATVLTAIGDAFDGQAATAGNNFDDILQNLIAADPYHFYDNNGKPIAAFLDNSTTLPVSSGLMVPFIAGDQIEITLKFNFAAKVSHDDVDYANATATGTATLLGSAQADVIAATDSFKVRLMLTAA